MIGAGNRFVIVAPWFGVNSGGAEKALLAIAETLAKLGCDVEIFSTKSEAPYRNWHDCQNLPDADTVNGLPVKRFAVSREGLEQYEQANRSLGQSEEVSSQQQEDFFNGGLRSDELIEAACDESEETIFIAGPYYQCLIHQLVAALPGRVFVMGAFHDETPFYWPPVGRLIRNAKGLVFLTEEEKDLTLRVHRDSIDRSIVEATVCGLPIKLSFKPEHSMPSLDQSERLKKPYVLYVGRVDQGKGLLELLNWHQTYQKTTEKTGGRLVKLVVVGKGDERVLTGYDVDHRGFVSLEEKESLINGALALVNLSKNESFSYVIMESWAEKRPVIVSAACDVTRNHVLRSKGGLIAGDENSYRQCLDVICDDERNVEMGKAGFTYVYNMYDPDIFSEKLLQLVTRS